MNANIMIGDLIQIITDDCDPGDDRSSGTVLKFDGYSGNEFTRAGLCEIAICGDVDVKHLGRRPRECIVEVLWNTGSIGWILESRIGRVQ